jgi:molybdenum cofactor cytidylyltransferase
MTIAAVIPAAGRSRRMGRDKRRIIWKDKTVLEHTVCALRAGDIEQIVVVLEPGSPCRFLAHLAGSRLLENPDPDRGMLSSIRIGLEHLAASDGVDAVAIQPGDHPFVPPAAVRALTQRFFASSPLLLVPRYPQSSGAVKKGHPLIIARALFSEALTCDDAVGLRQLLHERADDVSTLDLPYVDADCDLDTPADLATLLSK